MNQKRIFTVQCDGEHYIVSDEQGKEIINCIKYNYSQIINRLAKILSIETFDIELKNGGNCASGIDSIAA